MIRTIHFVAGLAAEEGSLLSSDKLLAMRLAKQFHPAAQVFLHTSKAPVTCDNYPREYVRRLTYDTSVYSGWQSSTADEFNHGWSQQGAQMSDKLRLHVLLTCQADNALYLDTDAYCVSNLDYLADIEGCAMARLNPHMVANGLIFAGRDRSFLRKWYDTMANAPAKPKSYVDWSCRLPHELAVTTPGLTVLDSARYHGVSGDEAVYERFWHEPAYGLGLRAIIDKSAVVHCMGCRSITDEDTNYQAMLKLLEAL